METVITILGSLCALAGGFTVAFLVPFATITGFRRASVGYLVMGVALLVIAYGLGIAPVLLLIPLVVFLTVFGTFFLLTIPGTRLLPAASRVSRDSVTTIADAVAACRRTGLQDWELVAYAQRLTAEKFAYCRRNPWDSPSRAFERGLGYCQQQALALNEIYRRLGIDSRPAYATKCRFPPQDDPGASLALVLGNRWLRTWLRNQQNVFGHTWLKVRVGDEELDVCPLDSDNRPGVAHFEPLSEVKTLHSWLQPFTHLGSAMANLMLDRQATRLGIGEA